jgi:RNA 3'-terminal phosphate cyclase (ATP)
MLTIDGSTGEGGGQIFRTSLALSLITGTAFRIHHIRQARAKPGLRPQHLAALQAAAAIGEASVEGAAVDAREVVFRPRRVRAGTYHFDVGTAGSTGLVLQTILLPLVLTRASSSVTLDGGTHNTHAPPFDFLAEAFLPLMRRMGAGVDAELQRPGFYPAGGGRVDVEITEGPGLTPLSVLHRGAMRRRRARAMVSRLPRQIADRELAVIGARLAWRADELETVVLSDGMTGPGNVVVLSVESERVTEVFTGFGERGVRAETVAERAADEVARYEAAGVPVGVHLADQLLLPLALAGGGAFRTMPLSLHATTNADVIRRFLDVTFDVARVTDSAVDVTVCC